MSAKAVEPPLKQGFNRALRAARQAKKRFAEDEYQKYKDQRWRYGYSMKQFYKAQWGMYTQAKYNYKEDWALGPRLQPRRDVGANRHSYGLMPQAALKMPEKPDAVRQTPWLAVGDRVAVLYGRDKNSIGEVTQVDAASETVVVKDKNEVEFIPPEHTMKQMGMEEGQKSIQKFNRPLFWSHVKLVTPLRHADGTDCDVVVQEVRLDCSRQWREANKRNPSVRPKRYIAGTTEEIPWPEAEPEEKKVDTPSDTLRITLDRQTFHPMLLRPPMPPSVIDELRNKYSKFRTRHNPEWLAEKAAQWEAVEAEKKAINELGKTPRMKKAEADMALRPEELPELTDEQLAFIGRTMAMGQQINGRQSQAQGDGTAQALAETASIGPLSEMQDVGPGASS